MIGDDRPITPESPHLDRIVPPIEAYGFAGMVVINRGGRCFQMVGATSEAAAHLASYAEQAVEVDRERAAYPDRFNFCRASLSDGECNWAGRHCPLDKGCPRCGRDEEECGC